jgi:holo-[acyl-carrier protein] synthase
LPVIGLGLDAVDIDRFRQALARRPGLAGRLFTIGERAYAEGQSDPAPSLAARFAAKEATMKALGVGLGAFRWQDVEVVRSESGRPSLVVRGAAAALAADQGVGNWHVSLTHTSRLAGAVVAALS